MITRRVILNWLAVLAVGLAAASAAAAEPPLKVVASFSILGDMVREVGGERVEVTTLVGADGDAHVYQPTPSDVRTVGAAGIIVVNGLGLEGWIDRLIKASGFKGPIVVASSGIVPIVGADEDGAHGDAHDAIDPHAWQSLANAAVYVHNIAAGLSAADPEGAAIYRANADRYLGEIAALDREVRERIAKIPPSRRKVVTSHDAFGYFAAAYGIAFLSPEGVSTDAEASAKDVARLIRQIRDEQIPAVFLENISDPRLMEQIRRETGAAIGGVLFSDALSPPDGPAPTYLLMFRHNVAVLTAALAG